MSLATMPPAGPQNAFLQNKDKSTCLFRLLEGSMIMCVPCLVSAIEKEREKKWDPLINVCNTFTGSGQNSNYKVANFFPFVFMEH